MGREPRHAAEPVQFWVPQVIPRSVFCASFEMRFPYGKIISIEEDADPVAHSDKRRVEIVVSPSEVRRLPGWFKGVVRDYASDLVRPSM